tara:strand:+ start:775 stop:1263 length:489 start_codon:yes stop_codon:yes gene_type:complete
MDKSRLRDDRGRPLTQALFLEMGYTDYSVFTLKEEDYEYKGKTYPSLKKLFVEFEDPTEYQFATTYLLGWQQWKKIVANQGLAKHINEWREELELRLVSQGIKDMIDQSADGGSFQASKYLADKGWDKRAAGRPSKKEQQKVQRISEKVSEEFGADILRLKR